MTLSYSRDPFCCFTTSQDLATFFDCHRQAFAHFGGVPMSIVYDRTKTVVRRHVASGEAVPLHPEAVSFAGHYDFDPDVLAGSVKLTVVLGLLGVQRRAAESRPSKVMSKAFRAAFQRWVRRLRPWPVGSRLMMAM